MNILLIGSGGREHALAWKLAASPSCDKLFIAPGNPGTAELGDNILLDVSDHAAVIAFCRAHEIGLVVVGPEAPLVAGLVDDLAAAGLRAFGPGKVAAQLEGSKSFTKELCAEYSIPTAAFARFDELEPARAYVREKGAPIVIKADGLAAGKGVVVAVTVTEAEEALDMMFSGALGQAGAAVVIEEFMAGEEASIFAISDGQSFVAFGDAQDHKRVFDGDLGPNTGGMGAYSPAPVVSAAVSQRVMDEIIAPTVAGMAARGTPYVGVLYAGVILTEAGPKLIEYNARFGDPECQVLMLRFRGDLVQVMLAAIEGRLQQLPPEQLAWSDEAALTVVMASAGYPGPVQAGSAIAGVADAAGPDVMIFHAGTKLADGALTAGGGRVLSVTARGPSVTEAQRRAYAAVDRIVWPEGFCRRDIGYRAVEREQQN